jgi:shikimate dehydrogenase
VLGVAGTPEVIANSLSPRMMRAAFDALGIEAHYVPLALRERSAAKALRALPRLGFRGCNVTMPYKPLAAEIAHTRSEAVERTGVANTLLVREDGTIHAEATDGIALRDALAERDVQLAGERIVLVGSGGVAMEAALACADLGAARIDVWNRTRAHAEALVERLRIVAPALELQVHDRMPIRESARVLLGCVPADALDPRSLSALHEDTLVVDFAYRRDGRPTPMMTAVSHRPERGVDGRELLVRQGAVAFREWFGVEAPIEVMTSAVR